MRDHNTPPFKDILGQKVGKLTVIGPRKVVNGITYWVCKCDCGTIKTILLGSLTTRMSQSCGCSRIKHGKSRSKIYRIFKAMHSRCYYLKNGEYHNYGQRGIFVADEWHKFENFYRDMGDPPQGRTLGRIDNNGPYRKENCRWADPVTQARNTRKNVILEHNGEKHLQCEWAKILGIEEGALSTRIKRGKKGDELFKPNMYPERATNRKYTYDNKTLLLSEWEEIYKLPKDALIRRIAAGWSFEKSIETPLQKPRVLTYKGVGRTFPEWAKILGVDVGILYWRYNKGYRGKKLLSAALPPSLRCKGLANEKTDEAQCSNLKAQEAQGQTR